MDPLFVAAASPVVAITGPVTIFITIRIAALVTAGLITTRSAAIRDGVGNS
jgi:hypothetical protein